MTSEALAWWLVVQGIGLIALPITLTLFQRLPWAGYAFAKPVGILLGGYLFWLALSLHLLSNRPGSIVWVYLLIGAVSFLIVRRRGPELRALIEERLGYILAVEVLFTLAFAAGIYLKSFLPEIAGTEKPMDFMLLNAATRSRYYAPDDPWLAGFQVSYYYFGYVINAMLGRLSALPTAVTFNVALASTAALAATAAFGLGSELVRIARGHFRAALAAGVAAAVLVTVMGNLEGVAEFAIANDYFGEGVVRHLDIAGLNDAKESKNCFFTAGRHCLEYPSEASSYWWWWRATRISPDAGTITEFPFFSLLLGDLHPHVMAIPFVLTVAAMALALSRSDSRLDIGFWRKRPALLLLTGVLLGGLGFLNTWDLPTFGFLMALAVFLHALSRDAEDPPEVRVSRAFESTAGFMAPLLLLSFLLYAPFYLGFATQADGFDAVTNGATRPVQTVLFWGPLVLLNLPLPLLLLRRDRRLLDERVISRSLMLPVVLVLLWLLLVLYNDGLGAIPDAIQARGWNWLVALFYGLALSAGLLALWRVVERLQVLRGREQGPGQDGDEATANHFVLAMSTTAFLLIFGAELFFVRDVFGSRLNTVFKLYYQAWLLLGIGGAYGLYRLLLPRVPAETRNWRVVRGVWAGVALIAVAGALLYPFGATLSRTEHLHRPNRTLDGLAYAGRDSRDDVAVLDWLRSRSGLEEHIVEATGGQYSAFARVSAWSGVPAVIGWSGHELQWGRDPRVLNQRLTDVDRAYSTESLEEALTILRKYGVTYVVVGSLELGKYPPAGLRKFETGLPTVFRSGQSAVYRVPVESRLTGEGQ